MCGRGQQVCVCGGQRMLQRLREGVGRFHDDGKLGFHIIYQLRDRIRRKEYEDEEHHRCQQGDEEITSELSKSNFICKSLERRNGKR